MQQVLPLAALVALVLWLLMRRPAASLVPEADGRAVAALNQARIGRLLVSGTVDPGADSVPAPSPTLPLTVTSSGTAPGEGVDEGSRSRRQRLRALEGALRDAGAEERLDALARCLLWGDRATLPLLQRARWDPHLPVAELAARGLERFRGRPTLQLAPRPGAAQRPGLPRNVARTR